MHLTVNEYFLTRKMRISISHEQQGSEAVTSWALLLQMKATIWTYLTVPVFVPHNTD